MIAMQYTFVLPADYDMTVIERRIADKGHLLDGFPGLLFKAYLSADTRQMTRAGGAAGDNLYAPFYLWGDSEGMNAFLCGAGFAGVTRAFGWPSVKTWSVWHASVGPDAALARYATRETVALAPHTALGALRDAEIAAARTAGERAGALAVVVGFEPTSWTLVRFCLWREMPASGAWSASDQLYRVGHISLAAPGGS